MLYYLKLLLHANNISLEVHVYEQKDGRARKEVMISKCMNLYIICFVGPKILLR